MELAEECPAVVIPRVTALVVDPEDHRTIWAGIEVDGVHRSLDGGETWTTIAGGLGDPDIHGIAVRRGQPKAVLATTPREVFASTDMGESWQRLEVMQQFPHAYTRAIAVKEDDSQVIFVGHGNTDIAHHWVGATLPGRRDNLGNLAPTRRAEQLYQLHRDPSSPTPTWCWPAPSTASCS